MTGHLSNNLPKVLVDQRRNCGSGDRGSGGRTVTGMCHICVGLAQHDDGIIPSNWLLLDVQITMDISKERAITVEYQEKVYKSKECQDVLYYYDTADDNSISDATNKSNAPITTYSFLSTLEDKNSYFRIN